MRTALLLVVFGVICASPASGTLDWCYDVRDSVYVEVEHGTITIHHDAALYNCAPDSIAYTWTQEGDTFRVVETEYNPSAYCLCCYELTTSMEDVPPGDYVIDFTWEDYVTGTEHRILCVTVPDEGQSGGPHGGGHTCSDCLDEPSGSVGPGAPGQGRLLLRPVEPNPVVTRAVLRFELASPGHVTLALFAPGGARVRRLLDGDRAAGAHAAEWDGRDDLGRRVAPGIYLCRLVAGGEAGVQRVLLIR